MFSSEKKQDIMNRKSRTLLLTDAYLKWSTFVLITIMYFKWFFRVHFKNEVSKKCIPHFFSNQEMNQTFCLFHFFPNLLLVGKKYENALKYVLISSNCTKHIQAGDIKVFCGYLKHVVVVYLRSNFMFSCGRLLGSCSLFQRTENNH